MIKKLSEKKLVSYQKYKGVNLTQKGRKIAINVIRKHRLWEYFLVEKLDFKWDEVHDMAEQLEHIQSDELVERLDAFLEHPKYDPHGDPIPDKDGNLNHHKDVSLSDLTAKESGVVVGVKEHSTSYLKYLESIDLLLGTTVKVKEIVDFDHSMNIQIGKKNLNISYQASKNLIIKKVS